MKDSSKQYDVLGSDGGGKKRGLAAILYRELVDGADIFYWIFLFGGIATQTVTYAITGLDLLSYVSGLCGIFSVLLCSRRKISMYVFGFLQILTYLVLAYQHRLYGEIAINIFYFVTMVYGCYAWARSYDEGVVTPKVLSVTTHIVIGILTFCSIFVVWRVLVYTSDSQPFMDSLTTVPALTAQILMVTRCKEQWWYWLVVDVAAIYMWFVAGNWCMVAQYVFWVGNCVYGQYKWKK